MHSRLGEVGALTEEPLPASTLSGAASVLQSADRKTVIVPSLRMLSPAQDLRGISRRKIH